MDNFTLRYGPVLIHEPPRLVNPIVSQEKFTTKDWQGLPRKRKKKVKKLMLSLNKLIDEC